MKKKVIAVTTIIVVFYFNRPNGGYELVLVKDEVTGKWIRPTEDMEAQD